MKTNGVPKIRFKGFTDDWEQRKVSDVSDRYDNLRVPVAANLRIKGSTPYYGANGIQDYVEGYTHDGEFVLIAEDGANDLKNYPVNYVNGRVWVNNHAHVLQAKESIADNHFIGYAISRANIESVLVGGGRAKLNAEVLMDINLKIPTKKEQVQISSFISSLDRLITLHQRKCDQTKELKKFMLQKMFPKKGEKNPEIRFSGFTDDWEQRKFSELYKKVSRKNDMTYGTEQIISVANMYYKVDANVKKQDYLKTYNIFELGDIAFEGNKSKHFAHGRFVENTIGNGIVSHVFDVFKPIMDFDLFFWKYYINYEGVMGPILTRVTKASTMMTNLVAKDFLSENILVPSIAEQQKIGEYFSNLDRLITLHQRKCEQLKELKKFMLQNMFPKKG